MREGPRITSGQFANRTLRTTLLVLVLATIGIAYWVLRDGGTEPRSGTHEARAAEPVIRPEIIAKTTPAPKPIDEFVAWQQRHNSSVEERPIARFPALAQRFKALEFEASSAEAKAARVIKEVDTDEATVVAVRITALTPEQLDPTYRGLTALLDSYSSDSAEGRAIAEEVARFRSDFLEYPKQHKILIATTLTKTGKSRLEEYFTDDPNRRVVAESGGAIRYGNDFPAADRSAFSDDRSWAKRRYGQIFELTESGLRSRLSPE